MDSKSVFEKINTDVIDELVNDRYIKYFSGKKIIQSMNEVGLYYDNLINVCVDFVSPLIHIEYIKNLLGRNAIYGIIYICIYKEIDISMISFIHEELFDILLMKLCVKNKLRNIKDEEFYNNIYNQYILYLSLEPELWVNKDLSTLLKEIRDGYITSNVILNDKRKKKFDRYIDDYIIVRKRFNNFIKVRELYMMIYKDLDNIIYEKDIKKGKINALKKHIIHYNDEKRYPSKNVLENEILRSQDNFFYIGNKLYYGKDDKYVEANKDIILKNSQILTLVEDDKTMNIMREIAGEYYKKLSDNDHYDLYELSMMFESYYKNPTIKYYIEILCNLRLLSTEINLFFEYSIYEGKRLPDMIKTLDENWKKVI